MRSTRSSGTKTFISNAGLATFYIVFARTDCVPGSRGLSAFVVDAAAPGFTVERQIPLLAPHPIGELRFDACRVPAEHRLGAEGEGLKTALRTLDLFRSSVGAAACGIAARGCKKRHIMPNIGGNSDRRCRFFRRRRLHSPTWRPNSTRRACSSIAPRGRRMRERPASRVSRQWQSYSPPKRRSVRSIGRCKSTAVSA